jgi:hypothetical protein
MRVAEGSRGRSRLRIAFVLELVAGLALAFAAARQCWPLGAPLAGPRPTLSRWLHDANVWIRPGLNAFAFAQACALLGLRAAGRGCEPFGVGRWSLVVVGLAWAVQSGLDFAESELRRLRNAGPISPAWIWREAFMSALTYRGAGSREVAVTLLAAWVALRLWRPSWPGPADAREWIGRAFGAFLIVWHVALVLVPAW